MILRTCSVFWFILERILSPRGRPKPVQNQLGIWPKKHTSFHVSRKGILHRARDENAAQKPFLTAVFF